jgi:cytochrome c peroxidase
MRISVCFLALAAACGSAPPKPVPDATREAVEPMPDAGARPANEPGGSSMGMADAGSDVLGAKADAGTARDGGANLREGPADAGVQAASAAGTAVADVSEALQKLPPAPPIPETPPFLPAVEESKDNPSTPEKVALGYKLFYDKRLSRDGSMSCESCHHPDLAYTSGNAVDPKVGGSMNKRNAPAMANVAYHQNGFYWDGRTPTMEAVCTAAWKGQLGVDKPDEVAAKLNAITAYRAEFQRAFESDATPKNVPLALAAFLRALKTGNAPWDKYEQGDAKAVSREARRGSQVFQNARCTLCHVPPLYTDSQFHNVGIGSDKPEAERDHGRMDATKDKADDGKFLTPSLRDVSRTAPYFHDGSAKALSDAVDRMLAGGVKNPNLDEKLRRAKLSPRDRRALLAYLEALAGQTTFPKAPDLP